MVHKVERTKWKKKKLFKRKKLILFFTLLIKTEINVNKKKCKAIMS